MSIQRIGILDTLRLEHKVAIIIGGAGGVGCAYAKAMVAASVDIVGAVIDECLKETTDELRSHTENVDRSNRVGISDRSPVDLLGSDTPDEFGHIDSMFA